MNLIQFLYRDSCLVEDATVQQLLNKLKPEVERIARERAVGDESRYASVYVPFNSRSLEQIKTLVQLKKALNPSMIVVIGIGGSNLGTLAAEQGLRSSHNIPLYYADTIDPDMLTPLLELAEATLKMGQQVLLNIVSKSGSTTETIINASLFLQVLKQYRPDDYQQYVVVTTEKDNNLWRIATTEKFAALEVPQNVGGRFSVLSVVGLFPLGMVGIDIDQLVVGAQQMTELCLRPGNNNYAAVSAAIMFALYKEGFIIHDFFPFAVDMNGVGLWYRQLIAESIGKEFADDGSRVSIGITPTVSIGSTDLHSMVELHMGGPRNTLTTFVAVQQRREQLTIPHDSVFAPLMQQAAGKSASVVLQAILQGVQRAYMQRQLPFITILFPEKTALYYGQFFQWKMLEIMYLGFLFGINPFEQPLVELYKNETRAILDHE